MIKVGDTAEVIKVLDSEYITLYNKNQSGVIVDEFITSGDVNAYVGKYMAGFSIKGWHIPRGHYKKIGRLKVRRVK